MANPIQLGLLSDFSPVFTMLFVFAFTYALLQYSKIFGENKSIHSIIAITLSFLVLLSPNIVKAINLMLPWYVVIMVLILVLLMAFGMLGARESDFENLLHSKTSVIYWVLIVSVIIFVASLGSIYFSGQPINQKDGNVMPRTSINGTISGDVGGEGVGAFWSTLFHPKVLGLIFTLLIGVFAISLLSSTPTP